MAFQTSRKQTGSEERTSASKSLSAKNDSLLSAQLAPVNPAGYSPAQLLQLQQTVGNQAVQRMLAAQRAPLVEEELQMKVDAAVQLASSGEDELQLKAATTSQPVQRKGSARKLPEHVQMKMESAMSADFSGVNVFEGGHATDIGALAYAQGNDIHFAPGQYNPDSRSGQELIGHELAHIVQQRSGRVRPTTEVNGVPINDDKGLEREADSLGRRAAGMPDLR